MPDLTGLIDRVRTAEKADAKLFRRIGKALVPTSEGEWWWQFERLIQAEAWESAALRLVEVKLPGWHAILSTEERMAELYPTVGVRRPAGIKAREKALTLALAIIACALTALIDGGRADG